MNRKLVGGLVAVVLGAVAIWFLFLRGGGDPAQTVAAGSGRSATIEKPAEKPKPAEDPGTGRGGPVRWQLDLDPEGPLQLEGQVLGPDGKGVGGAEVRLDSVPPRTAKAEDDGTFQFEKLVGRSYELTATSGDLVGSTRYKLTEKSDPAVIRIGEGAKLVVTVTDEAKAPIANATVRAADSERTARTDAKGEATLSPLQPGWVAAQASAEGYASASSFTTIGSGGATGRIAIVLRKGYAVSGRVVDDGGKAIAKARVTFSGAAWGLGGDRDDREEYMTDGKGQFTIRAVAAGEHTLMAVDGEHAPSTTDVSVVDRPVTGVEIRMKAGARIAGKVVDASKQPVPFATIRVAGADAQMFSVGARQATSDSKGAFELRGLARTKLAVRAESEAAASTIQKLDLSEQPAVDGVELVLDQTGSIAGIVVDETGAAVAEVTVHAYPDLTSGASADLMLAGMSTATTDGAGAFTIRGLPDGKWRIDAARSSTIGMRWGMGGTKAKTGDTNVRVTLATPGSVKGKLVVAATSQPPKLAMIQVGMQPPTPTSDGAFELREVEPGDHHITIRGPAFTDHEQRVKVEAGKTVDLGTITLQRGRRLTGKVVDGSGKPVADARVKVGEWLVTLEGDQGAYENIEEQQGIRSTRTGSDGSFEVVGIPVKGTSVMASHPAAGSSTATEIAAGADDPPPVTITLRGFGSIAGTVTSKGKPLSRVTITLTTKGGGKQMSFAQTDDKGSYKLAKVAEGAYIVQAMQADMLGTSFSSTTAAAMVTAGKQSKVDIDIPVGNVTLAVKLEPLPGASFDIVQTFLYSGAVAYSNAKQVMDGFTAGATKGMKIWMGKDSPMPEFTELVPGEYSICSIPITGSISDMELQRKLQQHMDKLKVYCKVVKVAASPVKQTVVHQLPSMAPLPEAK